MVVIAVRFLWDRNTKVSISAPSRTLFQQILPASTSLIEPAVQKLKIIMEAMFELLRRNGIAAKGLQGENPSKKAKIFAHFMASLWLFYSIGAWYGSRFVELDAEATSSEPILFGGAFVVWFLAFFGHIGTNLIRKKIKYG